MEIRSIFNYCARCTNMKDILEKRRQGIPVDDDELTKVRRHCAKCKSGKNGIYKADAILTALELHEEVNKLKTKRNVGKKPVREKQYGAAIRNLRAEGKTIREIASILKISKTTVQKIIKSQKEEMKASP